MKMNLNMGIFKNRTTVGLICIVLSLVICFGITPLFNSSLRSQTEIVRVTSDIKKGDAIGADKVEVVKVGAYNLPDNVMKSKDTAVGKYVNADMQKGDMILSTKLSDKPLTEFEYLNDLDGTKVAMSITIKSFAAGLSGKLEAGDIVTLISSNYDNMGTTNIPSELQYVKVLAATAETGTDKEYTSQKETDTDNPEKKLPATLTLLVNTEQAKVLADLEQKGNIHATLVYRGTKENADKFLNEQDKFFVKKVMPQTNSEQVIQNPVKEGVKANAE
ncbi:pilus assembly protein CpaB [Desulfitobacterium sp. LBE]|uniref:Flp pilus assembly protein CpaB n=1 Tax=Desulfitobacterium sp. LBE TaxID=884086 RepID=UPI00119AC472|nr:Flp pilus assembly protein CpaB [Desulfitobacterium sp. LBE]TWH59311.1 pilus assembly protein CpaB [Desulfitobacterium sp. LBE]